MMSSLVDNVQQTADDFEQAMLQLNTELRHHLVDLDFRDVTGTHEHKFFNPKVERVMHQRMRGTTDKNNGVIAVVDYEGHIWIHGGTERGESFHHNFDSLIRPILKSSYGCHVPHSNDGGWVVGHMWS